VKECHSFFKENITLHEVTEIVQTVKMTSFISVLVFDASVFPLSVFCVTVCVISVVLCVSALSLC